MRILLVTHYYSSHGGGIEIVAGTLATMLAREHEVVWAASDCDALPAGNQPSLQFLPMRSANAIERWTGLPFPLWGPLSLIRLWRQTRRADVVHLHDIAYFGNWAAFVFARLHRKPVLVTQHVGFIPYQRAVLRGALRVLHATAGRWILGRADRVVFVSRLVLEYFECLVQFREPPQVVANGVDVRTFVPASAEEQRLARVAIGLDPSRPLLLFVGRFVEKKGLHILAELARRLTDVSWVFAGWGPIDPATWNCPNVRVFAGLRAAALVPLYQAADLLVLPSVGEGLPLVVQESMSCGTPVLVGDDTAEAVDAPRELLFACKVGGAGTVDAWETVLRALLRDPQALADRQHAIAEFARSRWSWDECAATYARLLEQLLQVNAAGDPPSARDRASRS